MKMPYFEEIIAEAFERQGIDFAIMDMPEKAVDFQVMIDGKWISIDEIFNDNCEKACLEENV